MSADLLDLVLVRHGRTPMTARGAYSGSSVAGPELDEVGRAQVAGAAELVGRVGRSLWPDLAPPGRVLASPLIRTQQTAAAVAGVLGLDVDLDPAFAECDFGAWEGLTAAEIERGWPGQLRRWHRDAAIAPPGGESVQDVAARVGPAIDALLAREVGRTLVVITHSVVIRVVVGLALGAPATAWGGLRAATGSVSLVRLSPDGDHEVPVLGIPPGR